MRQSFSEYHLRGRQTPIRSSLDLARLLRSSRLMSIHARERVVPVTTEPSLDLLFEAFLRRTAERNGGSAPKLRDWVGLAEAWRIGHALRQCRGNRSAAARLLGIGRRTLYSKMEKLGITPSFSVAGVNGSAEASKPEILFP
jgi:transcriptional regulator with GAF, ATPase, and Fis domain